MAQEKTILIIEDETPLRQALIDKFTHEGFNVAYAVNGEEGLQDALQNHPDIILLDLLMPEMDGITLVKKLRENDWGKSAKVIILTNLDTNEDIAKAMDTGTYDYVIKSNASLEEIVEKVKTKIS